MMDVVDESVGSDVRVVVAEPTILYRELIEDALTGGPFQISPFMGRVVDLEKAAADVQAGVVLVGPGLARGGLDAVIPRLLAAGTKTMILSGRPLEPASARLLLAGASGFLLLADTDAEALSDAVLRVSGGTSALHPDVVHAVLQFWREQRAAAPEPATPLSAAALTTREMDVLNGLRDGLTTRLLAARLGLAEKTVEAHKSRLFAKLKARNQSQAVQNAVASGLL